MKVLMLPRREAFRSDESGIRRVVDAYWRHGAKHGIEFTDDVDGEYDIVAAHAGSLPGADVAICHGLYWTADYNTDGWEWEANAQVISTLRHAKVITVPSNWVAETIRRDLRVEPFIVGHGIEWEEWEEREDSLGYVLWNKNRIGDVCDPTPVKELARRFRAVRFVTTFYPKKDEAPANVMVTGVIEHSEMRRAIKQAGVYLATTKETFGIGVLEAMAAGVPVLGFAWGGNLDLVEHGISGYLARIGDHDDLAYGLEYCSRHAATLGAYGRDRARKYTWDKAVEKLRIAFSKAMPAERRKLFLREAK